MPRTKHLSRDAVILAMAHTYQSALDAAESRPARPVTHRARVFAARVVRVIEALSAESIDTVAGRVWQRDWVTTETLGYYLAHESMGSGVAYTDSHAPHGLCVPTAAFYGHGGEIDLRWMHGAVTTPERLERARELCAAWYPWLYGVSAEVTA